MTTVPIAAARDWGWRRDFKKRVEYDEIDCNRCALPNVGGIPARIKIMRMCDALAVGRVHGRAVLECYGCEKKSKTKALTLKTRTKTENTEKDELSAKTPGRLDAHALSSSFPVFSVFVCVIPC